jgi:hypothetical protein
MVTVGKVEVVAEHGAHGIGLCALESPPRLDGGVDDPWCVYGHAASVPGNR